jgi:hypothetical protein
MPPLSMGVPFGDDMLREGRQREHENANIKMGWRGESVRWAFWESGW